MNLLLTARQLDRLRELPPDHKVLTARTALRSSSDRMAGCGVCNRMATWHPRRLSRECDPTCALANSDEDDG
jgi:hypothetical protein